MWFLNKKNFLVLAPMADYVDSPFSCLCREIAGNNFIIFREMVSAEAIIRENQKTLKMCEINELEQPVIIQIFGMNPDVMTKAAKIVVDRYKPDGIDINMGCPVPKIAQKTRAGAALLKYPELASEIVKSIKSEDLGVPISVKTRLGWNDNDDILKFALVLQKAGADAISIHGRTKEQGYSGVADWNKIAEAKKILDIPVIANGDIKNKLDIKKCLEVTQADGVMIGRGALGNPWIFLDDFDINISLETVISTVLRHANLHIKYYGENSLVSLRKHLVWYFHGDRIPDSKINLKKIRTELVRVSNIEELKIILESLV